MAIETQVRSLFRLDAAFEVTLGLLLIVGGGLSWLTGSDFPVSVSLLIAAGAAFLLGGASTLLYFVRAPRVFCLSWRLAMARWHRPGSYGC
jgi:predicted lysophospholipase L1 biosynthesis ABC-type transport system permease subunit